MKTAMYWHREPSEGVQCDLCPHRCRIPEGRAGRCQIRRCVKGTLAASGYGFVSSAHLDPIEKKPLYHFFPGSAIFSIGGWGCNLACAFCQNWSISQEAPEDGGRCEVADLLARARAEGSECVAYTYNEPLINYEFVMGCCQQARSMGMRNVLVTNGFINREPADELLPFVDAINLDIKSMDNRFYEEHCRGSLAPVLEFARQAIGKGCHLEITNLVIPGLNDDSELLESMAQWISGNLGKTVPLHLSGYFPQYKMRVPATPKAVLERGWEVCRKHLPYVYVGNVETGKGQDTSCPGCGSLLIRRRGYRVEMVGLNSAACAHCGRTADIRR